MTEFRDELPVGSRDTEKKREAEKVLEEFREHPGKWGLLAESTDENDTTDKDLHNLASFYRRHFNEEFDVSKRGDQVWAKFRGTD